MANRAGNPPQLILRTTTTRSFRNETELRAYLLELHNRGHLGERGITEIIDRRRHYVMEHEDKTKVRVSISWEVLK